MRQLATAALLTLATVLAACSSGGDAATPAPTAEDGAPAEAAPSFSSFAAAVQGMTPADYYQASCASCHGVALEGAIGPPLSADLLTEPAEFYFDTIKFGRPGTAMPAWGTLGLTDPEVRTLVAHLRGDEIEAGESSGGGAPAIDLGIRALAAIEVPSIPRTASLPLDWTVTNQGDTPVDLVSFASPTLSIFTLNALPVELAPGGSTTLSLVFVPNPRGSDGDPVTGSATLRARTLEGVEQSVPLRIDSAIGPIEEPLRLTSMRLPDFPSRVATWDQYVYVGYLGGLIEVYRWTSATELELVESVDSIAATPNHGPDGTANPDATGRLIGGFAIDEQGTLYVSHSDPRLNEGDFLQTGHLADLNSGAVTALDGPPGSYGEPRNRRDLVTGLPRNVTNHMPLGLALDDGWLYIAVGAMTDSGLSDESKPQPDTDISGAVLRLRVDDPDAATLRLAEPGGEFATAEVLDPGYFEVYATGMRNAFGLAFGPDGELYLSDQSSDGGATPQPAGDDGPAGLAQNLGPDHLHRVLPGDYLGQPNLARGESILNDGSEYAIPIPNSDYSAPVHIFGTHNSATGIAWYDGHAFPDLDGWLLVSKFSGAAGLQALRFEGDRVAEVRVLATRPQLSNVTDVAVGPDGQVVIAEFWEKQLRVGRSYAPPPPSIASDHAYFGVNLDNAVDSLDAYAARAGLNPEVTVEFFRFPFRDVDRGNLASFLEAARAAQSIALVTLEPHEGLGAITPASIEEFAAITAAAEADGVSIMIRFAHEMNGSWYPWSQQPEAYVDAFRRLADAIHEAAPTASMLWATNYGGGYPFRGGAYESTSDDPSFEVLDTNGDGVLTGADDPYAPYYPGDDVVDWVGMSLYHWGNAYPWGENELPEEGKVVAQLRGEYDGLNGDDSALPDFYAEYADARGKPLAIPETAAFYNSALGSNEATIKSAWWSQVLDPELREQLPLLRMVNWFEHEKPEVEVGGATIDWRATADPALAEAFVDQVRSWANAGN